MIVMTHRFVLLCAVVAAVLIAVPAAWAQTSSGSAFVGTWEGRWEREKTLQNHVKKTSGAYSLVIERVTGDDAYGHGRSDSAKGDTQQFKFHGKIAGNHLTTESGMDLELDGNELHGTGRNDSKLFLQKKD